VIAYGDTMLILDGNRLDLKKMKMSEVMNHPIYNHPIYGDSISKDAILAIQVDNESAINKVEQIVESSIPIMFKNKLVNH